MLLTVMSLLAVACSSDEAGDVNAQVASTSGKTLVVYYSYTNNCREIVTTLTSQIEADVLEIQPAEKGQKYEANNYALGMQLLNDIKGAPNDASSYPAIDPVGISLSGYVNIIIVTPLWWSQMAAPMQTCLFNYGSQMAGKKVGLIVSSGSSGISGVVADAKRLLPHVTWMGDALSIKDSNRSNRSTLIRNWLNTQNFAEVQTAMDKINITIDGVTKTIELENNAATKALVGKLKEQPVSVTLNTNGNFEIWGSLGFPLPTSDESINGQSGDVVLYNGSYICLFYGSNSYSYTRLGKIKGLTANELKTFLKGGQNNISVTLSLPGVTAVRSLSATQPARGKEVYYTLNGQTVTAPRKGIYIVNGEKRIVE